MNDLAVIVRSGQPHIQELLTIPCAEAQVASLVKQNLSQLFPEATVTIETIGKVASNIHHKRGHNLSSKLLEQNLTALKIYGELEESLFHDVA